MHQLYVSMHAHSHHRHKRGARGRYDDDSSWRGALCRPAVCAAPAHGSRGGAGSSSHTWPSRPLHCCRTALRSSMEAVGRCWQDSTAAGQPSHGCVPCKRARRLRTCHVCGSDHQQAPLSHGLDCRVQKVGRGAVGIEVHSIIPARPLQHDQPRIPLPQRRPASREATSKHGRALCLLYGLFQRLARDSD